MYTIPQVARRIGCTRSNVYHHVRAGNLPAIRVGGVFIIDEADAKAFAERYDRAWQSEGSPRRKPGTNST